MKNKEGACAGRHKGCWSHSPRQRSFQQDSCRTLAFAHTLNLQGHRPLSQWVSSQERDPAEGPRGPLQSFLWAAAEAEDGGGVG